MSRPQLELRGVSLRYENMAGNSRVILDGVDLRVQENEFLCIVGPSGCGKSSMLNLFSGLILPTQGEVYLRGKPAQAPGPERCLVFQEGALFPWLTVFENVAFGLNLQGRKRDEVTAIVQRQLGRVGLGQVADHYVHQLSGGMKQRVAIARAFALNPQIILMDEPFAALDAQTRDQMQEELQKLWSEDKKTVIFVTHNVREAACLADRAILISKDPGQITKEYINDLPRPRSIEDPAVMKFAQQILTDLKGLPSWSKKP